MLRVDGVRGSRGGWRRRLALGGQRCSTLAGRRWLPALVQRPVLVVVWSGNNLGLPRRLPLLLIALAFAALGTAKT